MTHPFLMVWLLLMIRFEFVYVYFIATKNVGDYSYMSSPNIYYRAQKEPPHRGDSFTSNQRLPVFHH